jgi:general secretion pathway protein J
MPAIVLPALRRVASPPPRRGFTLVEVLVALFALAVLATLAWQGLTMLMGARDATARSLAATQRLNSIVLQWEQDLQALVDTEVVPALQFDGRALRLTRRGREAGDGAVLVVWSLEDGRWRRWAAPPLVAMAELQEAWLRSQQLQADDPAQVLLAEGVEGWQLYFHRGGAWSNAQSSGDLATLPPPRARLRVAPAAAAPAGGTGGSGAPTSEKPGASGSPGPARPLEGGAGGALNDGARESGTGNPSPGGAGTGAAGGGGGGASGVVGGGGGATGVREALPAAVRLSIGFAGQRTLQRDIALAPGVAP